MELPIIIERITFQRDNFCILAANLDPFSPKYKVEMEEMLKPAISPKYNTFTVILNNLMNSENLLGGQYIFVGELENDSKRGLQFKAEFYYMDTPSTEEGLRAFLMVLPNIKEVRSQVILEKWGIDGVIDILDNNPEKLLEIPGITAKRIPPIKKEWDTKIYLCKFYHWLSSHNINITMADKIYRKFGDKSLETLQNNPYELCSIPGIGFLTADRIAYQILENVPFNFRIKACVDYVLKDQTTSESNLCIPYGVLKKHVVEWISKCDANMNKKTDVDECLSAIISVLKVDSNNEKSEFEIVKDIEENPNVIYIYHMNVWEKEKYIGESLLCRSLYKPQVSDMVKRVIDNTLNDLGK